MPHGRTSYSVESLKPEVIFRLPKPLWYIEFGDAIDDFRRVITGVDDLSMLSYDDYEIVKEAHAVMVAFDKEEEEEREEEDEWIAENRENWERYIRIKTEVERRNSLKRKREAGDRDNNEFGDSRL